MKSYVLWCLAMTSVASGASGQDGSRQVSVAPAFDSYQAGSVVRLAVRNPTGSMIHRMSCGTIVQRLTTAGTWEDAGRSVCPPTATNKAALVMPETTTQVDVPLAPSLPPGDYRVILDMRHPGGPQLPEAERASVRFRVDPLRRPITFGIGHTAERVYEQKVPRASPLLTRKYS